MKNLEEQINIQSTEKDNEHPIKKRIIFYSLLLSISGFIGYAPLWYVDMGLLGLVFWSYWLLLAIIDIIVYFIYEFTHLPGKEHIDFKLQKNISLIYLILSTLSLVYLLVIFILYVSVGSKINANFFVTISPFLILVLFDLWYYTTACKLNAISRKLAIITTLATLALITYLFFLIPKTIQSYGYMKDRNIYLTALNNNDLKTCLEVQNDAVCKKELAIKYNDPQLCLQIPDSISGDFRETERYSCLYVIAKNTKDEAICDLIAENVKDKWNTAASSCIKGILTVKQKEITVGLTDEQIAQQAIAENNFDLCLGISHIDHNRTCQLGVAKINNINYCEKIDKFNGGKQISDCYEYYKNIDSGTEKTLTILIKTQGEAVVQAKKLSKGLEGFSARFAPANIEGTAYFQKDYNYWLVSFWPENSADIWYTIYILPDGTMTYEGTEVGG